MECAVFWSLLGSSPHPSMTEEEDSQSELLIAEEKMSPEQAGQLMPRYSASSSPNTGVSVDVSVPTHPAKLWQEAPSLYSCSTAGGCWTNGKTSTRRNEGIFLVCKSYRKQERVLISGLAFVEMSKVQCM